MFGLSAAVWSLIVFVICIILFVWDKFPTVVVAFMGCAAMVILNIAPFKTVFGELASTSVYLVISMMIVGRALFHTGIADLISEKILKFAGNSERRLLIVSVTLAGVISAFMSNVGTLAMFMSIFSSFTQTGNKKLDLKNLMLPISMATVIGGGCTLVGSGPQIAAQGLLEATYGKGISFFELAKVGSIMVLALVLYVAFLGYPLGKKIWGDREETERKDETIERAFDDKKHMIICASIFVLMTVGFITEPFPIAAVGVTGALLCILTGCIDLDQAIKGISWRSVGQLAGCLGLMAGLDHAGGAELIYGGIIRMLGDNVSPFILFVVLVIVVFVLSEFLTNTVAIVLVLPIIFQLAETMSLNPTAFTVGLVLASTAPMSTPLSCTPLTMVMEYGYKFRDYAKYALPYDAIALAIIIIFTPLFYSLTI